MTTFLDVHPGSDDTIVHYLGKGMILNSFVFPNHLDITEVFKDPRSHEHSKSSYKLFPRFEVSLNYPKHVHIPFSLYIICMHNSYSDPGKS